MFNRELDRRVDQYTAEDEGEDDVHDEPTDLTDEFEALVVEVKGTSILEESEAFMTEVGHLIKQDQATDVIIMLSDQATARRIVLASRRIVLSNLWSVHHAELDGTRRDLILRSSKSRQGVVQKGLF